jgi:CHAT domain-containing protein/predicted negative regulator of RcsB-dependent stress response
MKTKIIFSLLFGLFCLINPEKLLANSAIINNSQTLEQKAQHLYERGRLQKAISLLKQAINNHQKQDDLMGEAIATINLALVYQQLGQWQTAEQSLSSVINFIPKISNRREQKRLRAQALDVRGQIQLSLDRPEEALATWQKSTNLYQEIKDIAGFTRGEIYQAQALQSLGLYARAVENLSQVQQQLEKQPNNLIKSKALLSLGDILRRVGRYDDAQLALNQSLEIAQKFPSKQAIADIYLGLGNNARVQQNKKDALEFYQKAIQSSTISDTKIQGNLALIGLAIENKEWGKVKTLVTETENLLKRSPSDRTLINSRIALAKQLMKSKQKEEKFPIVDYLATAIKQAQNLGDRRIEAEAMGNLGTLYERHQRFEEAQQLTDKALLIAQEIRATDLAYQWQWQLGRIHRAKGEKKEAIAAYSAAIKNLQSLRGDLVAISSQLQFSFRQQVEPVYREFVELLLQENASQENLKQARSVIEALQLAQLDNFFRDACIDTQSVQIDNLDPKAAIIYTIILSDRLETIAALPGQPLRHYTVKLKRQQIEENLSLANSTIQSSWQPLDLEPLQQLYDWLIRPIEAELVANKIDTLVFVPDGLLRNIPPSVLHDGEKYLVEKYNLAIAPSLQLIQSQPIAQTNRELLLAGLTEARQGFTSLPGVRSELKSIESEFPARILLNQSFTEANFDKIINTSTAQLIHIATHGQFSSKAEDTFILTWDNRITINELQSLLQADRQQLRPIELLVLSACQTAAGDEQAALGIAGMAVRTGARSTIATLWDVSDRSTTILMSYFYKELANTDLSKAEALRRAQQKVLRDRNFSHPYYWSAFILVGNWL